MKNETNKGSTAFFIQEIFNSLFPNLKMVFHQQPASHVKTPASKKIREHSNILSVWSTIHRSEMAARLPATTAGELKQVSCNEYPLSMNIFQKNRNNNSASPANNRATLKERNEEIPYVLAASDSYC
jgi:hypothetical protein